MGKVNFIHNNKNNFPEPLFQMFVNENNRNYSAFQENIRILNNNFGFISTNAGFVGNVNRKLKAKGGVPIIRIDGALYHLYSDKTFPDNEENASHSHLYVLDEDSALNSRQHNLHQKHRKMVEEINSVIQQNNEYAKAYKTLREK